LDNIDLAAYRTHGKPFFLIKDERDTAPDKKMTVIEHTIAATCHTITGGKKE
jgi:hypothetical protein